MGMVLPCRSFSSPQNNPTLQISFSIFQASPIHFLPRVHCVLGTNYQTSSPNGQVCLEANASMRCHRQARLDKSPRSKPIPASVNGCSLNLPSLS